MLQSRSRMTELDRARTLLAERFGYSAFLPGQEDSLRSILSDRNLLVVMPTGSGKSLLYQLPALMQGGLTVVVSPLIALMKDQVDELSKKDIPATFVNSSLSLDEQQARLKLCAGNKVRLLYVAPERLRNAGFLRALRSTRVCRIAIDEAHCISEWGHDFRPDYRRLKQFRKEMNWPRVTALTATATPDVQNDIIQSLGLRTDEVDVHVRGFDRPNLVLSVREFAAARARDGFVLDFVRNQAGSTIIYTPTRRNAEKLGNSLASVEPRTTVYHAGLDNDRRTEVQERFMTGHDRVVVATCAFGMGIDKPDIRSVLHYGCAGSVEQYYQEIGRAGRDGKTSRCILLHSSRDLRIHEFFIDVNYPGREIVKEVYEELFKIEANPVLLTYDEIADRCQAKIKEGHVGSAVRLLDAADVTRAHSGEPMVAVTLNKPGSIVMSKLHGPAQIRVLEGLSASEDIETPGRHEIGLRQLCRAAGLSEDQVRRALNSMRTDGAIEYEPPFRGRGVEKLVSPAPRFEDLPIDWERQARLRQAEEQKLEAMEAYIGYRGCRREFILRYFGEKQTFHCGTCDRCSSSGRRGQLAHPSASATEPGHTVHAFDDDAICAAVLECVSAFHSPRGIRSVAEVLTGSKAKWIVPAGAHRFEVYDSLRVPRAHIELVINSMIEGGLLRIDRTDRYPLLKSTNAGLELLRETQDKEKQGATGSQIDDAERESVKPMTLRISPSDWAGKLDELLDVAIARLLHAPSEEAKEVIPRLRMFHPMVIAVRLQRNFDACKDERVRARVVWALGELCGRYGLPFLLNCASSHAANIRRLTASAMGKVAESVRRSGASVSEDTERARRALLKLAEDAGVQVRHHAEKSLKEFPP